MMAKIWLNILVATLPSLTLASPSLPESLDLTSIRAVPAQHDGRWCPVDTLARDLVESVTGDVVYQGRDPVLTLLAWTFDPQEWRNEPLISIGNAELRRELQLSATQTAFSHAELTGHRHLHVLVDELSRIPKGKKLNPLQAKVSDIHQRLLVLHGVFQGDAIKLIPDPDNPLGTWTPLASSTMPPPERAEQAREVWSNVRTAFLADDAAAFLSASQRLASTLQSLPAVHRPAERLIATELRYNKLRPFRTAWKMMIVGAALAAAAMGVRRRWFDVVAVIAMLAGFVVLSYGLALRWQIAGRIPASNMFESLLFLSWGMGAFAILSMLVFKDRVVPLTASAMGALALVLADCLPMDQFIRPIAPVLMDTVWMSIHVPVIMVSYSVLALGMLVAHVQLVTMALVPNRRDLAATIDTLHYWYIHVGSILLLAGIVTGSMWAASSWGRYWGWDPKEVWSLVALLGYLTILHVRVDRERVPPWAYVIGLLLAIGVLLVIVPKLAPLSIGKIIGLTGACVAVVIFVLARGAFATALKSVLAFWLIIMTYIGVNYVLGIGLHSYGFGTGAVVHYMFLIGGIDLGLVVIFTVIYVARRGSGATTAPMASITGPTS